MNTPKIRPEAKDILTNIIKSAIEREHNYLYQSCINCEFFEKDETCFLVKKRPPAKVIVLGCERWMEKDSIPF